MIPKVLGAKKRAEVAKKLASRVKAKYGEMKRRKLKPPLDQLVLSLICHHASARRATGALRQFQRLFVNWNEVRVSPLAEVAHCMSGAAWAAAAAKTISSVLDGLFATRNALDLQFLQEELTTAQARTFLQSLPAVGRHVADEVLLMSLQVDVLPLSDEGARLCCRLGLTGNERPTLANQKTLMAYWDPALYAGLTLYFSDEPKSICRLEAPRCSQCGMKSVCPKEGV